MNPQGWGQDAQVQAIWIPNTERRRRYKLLCPTQKLSLIANCSQRKNQFSPVESHWVCKPHVRLASYAPVEIANANQIQCYFWILFVSYFGIFLSHTLGFFKISFVFCILQFLVSCFYGFYVCLSMYVSLRFCPVFLCVLYLILIHLLFYLSFCFIRRERSCGVRWIECGEGLGANEGGETCQNILYTNSLTKNVFYFNIWLSITPTFTKNFTRNFYNHVKVRK